MSKVKDVTCIFWLSFGAFLVAGVAVDFVRDVRPILEEHCLIVMGWRIGGAALCEGGEWGESFGEKGRVYLFGRHKLKKCFQNV